MISLILTLLFIWKADDAARLAAVIVIQRVVVLRVATSEAFEGLVAFELYLAVENSSSLLLGDSKLLEGESGVFYDDLARGFDFDVWLSICHWLIFQVG